MSVTASPQQNPLRDLAIAALQHAHREIGNADQRLVPLDEAASRSEIEKDAARRRADEPSPAAGQQPRARRRRPLLWSFLGLLASAGIGVAAFAWQKASEEAASDPITTATATTAIRESPEQPSGIAVKTELALPQPSPQASPQHAGQLAQADPAQAQTMTRELANVEQAIDQLKRERAQIMRDNAEVADRLKATQELARRSADIAENLKATQAEVIRQNADLADDLKAARAQTTRDNAEFTERLKASQEQMAKLSEQLKTSQEQLARLTASERKPRPKPVASAPTATAAAVRRVAPTTAPPPPQARVQTQDPRRLPPRPQ
jgi:ABC-type transporter Mla subunit MlaD